MTFVFSKGNVLTYLVNRTYKYKFNIIKVKNSYIESEILNYLDKKSRTINIKPYFLIGNDFEKSVYGKVMEVLYSETASYKDIANLINKPNSYRAVGTAVGKNPLLLLVPCHRIIKNNKEIGNFSSGIKIKKFLLELENK
jgi:O-6-methylguanine DNA methyltransferase